MILLVILSHRPGRAGAAAVCLMGCALGVGSIIRLLRHPAAKPASSPPADLISYLNREGGGVLSSLMNSNKKHLQLL